MRTAAVGAAAGAAVADVGNGTELQPATVQATTIAEIDNFNIKYLPVL
jgi:hypothetical protein